MHRTHSLTDWPPLQLGGIYFQLQDWENYLETSLMMYAMSPTEPSVSLNVASAYSLYMLIFACYIHDIRTHTLCIMQPGKTRQGHRIHQEEPQDRFAVLLILAACVYHPLHLLASHRWILLCALLLRLSVDVFGSKECRGQEITPTRCRIGCL